MARETIDALVLSMSADLKRMEKAYANVIQKTDRTATDIEKRFERMNRKVSSLGKDMTDQLTRSIAAIGVGLAIRETIGYADAWTEARNKLAAAGIAAEQLGATQSRLVQVALKTRTELGATVDLYARLTRSTQTLGATQEEVFRATEILNKGFKAGGASASEQASAILQLGQALGSGVLQGDELRSIRENAPLVAKAIADEFGVTTAELKKLGAQGELTTDRVFKGILKAGEEIDGQFKVTVSTVADSFTNLRTAFTQYIGEADRAGGATRALSGFINNVAIDFDRFADAVVVAALAIGGVLAARSMVLLVAQLNGITAATVGLAGAMRALQLAMVFLSSPWGAAVAGLVAALVGIYVATHRAKEEMPKLADRMDSVSKAIRRTDVAIEDSKMLELGDNAKAAVKPLDDVQKKLADIEKQMLANGRAAQQAAIDGLAAERIGLVGEIRSLQGRLDRINAQIDKAAASGGTRPGLYSARKELAAQLEAALKVDAEAETRMRELLRSKPEAFKTETTTTTIDVEVEKSKLQSYQTDLEEYLATLKEIRASKEDDAVKSRAAVQALLDYANATKDVAAAFKVMPDMQGLLVGEDGALLTAELMKLADEAAAAVAQGFDKIQRDFLKTIAEIEKARAAAIATGLQDLAAFDQAAAAAMRDFEDAVDELTRVENPFASEGDLDISWLPDAEDFTYAGAEFEKIMRESVKDALKQGIETGDWGKSFAAILADSVAAGLDDVLNKLGDALADILLGTNGNTGWLSQLGNFLGGAFTSGSSVPRASGGPTMSGARHKVNETGKGEFLFMGKNPGQVLTAAQIASMGSVKRGLGGQSLDASVHFYGPVDASTLPEIERMMNAKIGRVLDAMPTMVQGINLTGRRFKKPGFR